MLEAELAGFNSHAWSYIMAGRDTRVLLSYHDLSFIFLLHKSSLLHLEGCRVKFIWLSRKIFHSWKLRSWIM